MDIHALNSQNYSMRCVVSIPLFIKKSEPQSGITSKIIELGLSPGRAETKPTPIVFTLKPLLREITWQSV